jgi:hypothetical protein
MRGNGWARQDDAPPVNREEGVKRMKTGGMLFRSMGISTHTTHDEKNAVRCGDDELKFIFPTVDSNLKDLQSDWTFVGTHDLHKKVSHYPGRDD